MVNAFIIVVAALAASVTARPISGRAKDNGGDVSLGDLADLIGAAATATATADAAAGTDDNTVPPGFTNFGGVIIPAGNNDAHDEQQAEFSSASIAAAAAETAAGIDIAASIAAASSSAAAAAATASVNPLDPLPAQNTNLTPEQLGQLSGLRAKLQIDDQFGDTGAAIDDQEAIDALIEDGEGSFGF
ncbi:hypothetical protein DFH08DRAFT_1085117 [Mycena albidolilacea]|uniref:Uncharacterized protein n=1 Tax=Mycena albidolilacea TaxID=1033008 RepID=A0AAD6ZJP2_9AGAR|nr:hypothetical protein DFH08DRAFT_1085117 [Mycena albidolilacea]